MARKRTHPVRRVNPKTGKTTWVARPTNPEGHRETHGTFKKRGPCGETGRDDCCCQHRIDAVYDAWETTVAGAPITVGEYASTWTTRRPRSVRTNATNDHRVSRVLDVEIEERPLRDWSFDELRRRHVHDLVDHMLRKQSRSASGATNILRVLSALFEDAMSDEVADPNRINPFKGVPVREGDSRVKKEPRPTRIWSLEQMRAFAAAGGHYEAMIRVVTDLAVRPNELLAMLREGFDRQAGTLRVSGSAWNGQVAPSSREKNHKRTIQLPAGLLALLLAMPPRIDSPWLFPTPTGCMWRYDNWRRDVWIPTAKRAGIDPTPRECRHSWESILRADPEVNGGDAARIAGHTDATGATRYTHPLGGTNARIMELLA